MPKLARYFLKAGLLYFVTAMLLLVWMSWPDSAWPVGLRSVFYHMLTVGWISQIIFGVSIWMFPRPFSGGRRPADQTPVSGWFVFWTLNAGLVLRVFTEPLIQNRHSLTAAVLLTVSAILQWIGVVVYTAIIWKRIRGKK